MPVTAERWVNWRRKKWLNYFAHINVADFAKNIEKRTSKSDDRKTEKQCQFRSYIDNEKLIR